MYLTCYTVHLLYYIFYCLSVVPLNLPVDEASQTQRLCDFLHRMAIFTDGKSTAINSPRHLTLRHAIRAVKINKSIKENWSNDAKARLQLPLEPGQEKLFSFYAPSLTAGKTHHIKVEQKITSNNGKKESLKLEGLQKFSVEAPQYSLPEGSIYSVYPPPGYTEEARILPHVVLSDPHLPWERQSSRQPIRDNNRNRVPWFALILFAQDELCLPIEDRDGDTSLFPSPDKSPSLKKPVQQSSTQAIRMSLKDVESTKSIVSPIKAGDDDEKTVTDFIFMKPELFTSLFSPFDESNHRQDVKNPDISPYRFLSHVRKMNSAGMAIAGAEDIALFAVMVSNRSGPLDNPKATTVSAHLVSLEGVEENISFPISSDKKYAALCSLYSWSYTVTPPVMLNVPDAFNSLGETLGLLRPPDKAIQVIQSKVEDENSMPARLAKRLEDGYTLVKHRTQTGEMTLALFRGPFTPTAVDRRWKASEDNDAGLHRCSNSGFDLQILDKGVGIMDISYSVAWQVGRMLALADQPFTTALIRLRTAIHQEAMIESKKIALKKWKDGCYIDKKELLAGLSTMCANLGKITVAGEGGNDAFIAQPPPKRWKRPALTKPEYPPLDYLSKVIEKEYPEQAVKAAYKLAMGTDGKVYDETNNPVSVDWMVVLAWVMNRMFLDGVPAHYLITDPSHLEQERLKFFHTDANWTDALIDGALSPGNHLGEDRDRVAIKQALNRYIYEKPADLAHSPQIPTYGFYLRSDLVSMFPDLKVTTLPEPKSYPAEKAPLLRHEIIADGVMLGMLDRVPRKREFDGLVFTQPPHQQRFAVARTLKVDRISVRIRKQYTVEEKYRPTGGTSKQPLEIPDLPTKPNDPNNLFTWGSQPGQTDLHMIRLPRLAVIQLEALQKHMGKFKNEDGVDTDYFNDDTATSALLALQLSDPIYSLRVDLQKMKGVGIATPDIRTFNLLAPSMVNYAITGLQPDPPMQPVPEPEPESASDVASTSFERPAESKLAPYFNDFTMAPHTIPIHTEIATSESKPQIQLSRPTASAAGSNDGERASPPTYKCRVSSVGLNVILVDKDNLPQDLIFSIRVSNNDNPGYEIRAFHIWIKLGKTSPNNLRLMENYTGTGAFMLSNLRFNVLPKFDDEPDGNRILRLSLLPRSTKQYVKIPLVQEMSFMLSLAQVNMYEIDPAQMTLRWRAEYNSPSTPAAEGDFLATVYHK